MIVDGLTLESTWVGQCDGGPELVFLHEGLGSITQWRDTPAQIVELSGRPGLVYARQGYGKSDPAVVPRPLTYMHDEAARLPAILATEQVHGPILIGHSDGASIAIIATGAHLVKPRALVLIAPHVFVEDVSVRSIEQARDTYTELRPKLARHHADVDGAFWGWNRAWLDPDFRAWNIEAYLATITVPVLIVQGEADEYGTVAQVEAIARRVPSEIFLVAGAGHTPQRTHPDAVHARIAQFIRQVTSTKAD